MSQSEMGTQATVHWQVHIRGAVARVLLHREKPVVYYGEIITLLCRELGNQQPGAAGSHPGGMLVGAQCGDGHHARPPIIPRANGFQ
jgi:hypothetical protein